MGVLLDGYQAPDWVRCLLQRIADSDCAVVEVLILNRGAPPPGPPAVAERLAGGWRALLGDAYRKALFGLYRTFVDRRPQIRNARAKVDLRALLAGVREMHVTPVSTRHSDRFTDDDIAQIRALDLDVILRCGFRILRGDILASARYGVWSYHHGDNRVNRGGPAGFWESLQSWPETGSVLQILTEDLDNGQVLYRSYSCTEPMSLTDTRSVSYWKSVSFVLRKLNELFERGEAFFESERARLNRHPEFYSRRLYRKPTNAELTKLIAVKFLEKAVTMYHNTFFRRQWNLFYAFSGELPTSMWRYKRLRPPADRFWADPFPFFRDGQHHIFLEEYDYGRQLGHISVMSIDRSGQCGAPVPILKTDYHLSYPFVFEHEGGVYMVPESAGNSTVDLYRCVEYPHKWEKHLTLMRDIKAHDATLLRHDGRWWLFATVIEVEGASSCDELFVFHSESLFSETWTPHPQNPVVSDCKSARPAGALFEHGGRLYRPSQNCSKRYGYGFNLCHVETLTENEYAETIVSTVLPEWDTRLLGTHTFNHSHGLYVVDGLYRRLNRS